MVQFLLISLLVPPLLIMGVPRRALTALEGRRVCSAIRWITRPMVAIVLFNAVVVATHWPQVVDVLMASQWGSVVLDLSWLLAGLILWWPVVSPIPARPGFPFGIRMAYLILCTVLMTLPYLFLTFAELPFYSTYELAPPVGSLSTRQDQRLAGLIMRIGGGAILWSGAGILFWLWYRDENDPQPAERPA